MAELIRTADMVAMVAERAGVTEAVARAVLQAQAELAYANSGDGGFPIPGIGRLTMYEAPPRDMVMMFGPKKGQTIRVPFKRRVKFHIALIAREAILAGKTVEGLFTYDMVPEPEDPAVD